MKKTPRTAVQSLVSAASVGASRGPLSGYPGHDGPPPDGQGAIVCGVNLGMTSLGEQNTERL